MLTHLFSFPGHNVVSKSKSQDETGYGRAEKGRRECEDFDHSEEFHGKRQRYESPEEEINQCQQSLRKSEFAKFTLNLFCCNPRLFF